MASDDSARTSIAWLLLPWSTGVLLLTWGLGGSILAGDELHLIRALRSAGPLELMVEFRLQDHCRPLSGFYALWLASGLPLGAWGLRAFPSSVALSLLFVGPLWVRREFGVRPAVAFAWILATSPLFVFYGRLLRPYGIVMLLVPTCLVLYASWERHGRGRDLLAHAMVGGLATWFHPVVAPLVLSPALGELLASGMARDRERTLRSLFAPVLTGSAMLIHLLPAGPSLRTLVGSKAGSGRLPNAETLWDALSMLAGSSWAPLALGALALAATGLRTILSQRPDLGRLLVITAVCQVVGIWILQPRGVSAAIQVARYLVGLLPGLLLCVAVGWSGWTEGWNRLLVRSIAVLGVLALLGTGPLVSGPFLLGDFAHHKDLIGFFAPPARLRGPVPEPYSRLSRFPGRDAVIEAPGPSAWRRNRLFYAYQAVHRRPVVLALDESVEIPGRLVLPGIVFAEATDELSDRGRFLVLHHDLGREADSLILQWRSPESALRVRPKENKSLRRQAAALERRYRSAFGHPFAVDDAVSVWDLWTSPSPENDPREPNGL